MNILPAYEVKKHGVVVIEQRLKHGPVHILKHNQPIFVALTEEDYQHLLSKNQKSKKVSGLFMMLDKPVTGKRTRADIDAKFKQERNEWD